MARGLLSLFFLLFFLSNAIADLAGDLSSELSSLKLMGNDKYSCSKDKPCSNGACCGKNGVCGFGKTYCGTTGKSPNDACWSNCNAHAECSKDAKEPGKECPLNVCCSEFGFCGTTEEFCGDGCQSKDKCKQPDSGASGGNVQERIIGYYEAFKYDSDCQDMKIHQIPVESLTHVNYAFAYIDPDSYDIGPMPDIEEKTLKDFTALKERNPHVVLGVSLGGWTFNDNKTDTQKVFAEIASKEDKRSKFIDKLLSFMRHYGFDAVDIDWEYPGAPDRQPKGWDSKDDGKNYVKLLQDIRKAFDDQDLEYELSFTAPTSYWYLRWFDIHNMVKAATYMNLMSYDLHGVWDSNNPIGNHVLGHTNMTEIDQALDLLWRNDVPAKKVNMGLAFYARTFELKDKKCHKPGCTFKHGGKKGACTDTEGILSYNEIVGIIADDEIKPVYDKENAIKYLVWDENQWISYDDQQTFQQKIKLFNEKGLGGLLIWAIDQDTRNLDALRGVLYPEDVVMTDSMKDDTSYWESQHPGDCRTTECSKHCPTGTIEMDTFKCPDGGDKGDSRICCPIAAAPDPDTCHWRGGESGSLCNGQCHGGEVALASAVDGGNGHCSDGRQFYCCPIPEVAAGGCINCGWKDTCSDDQEPLTFAGTFLEAVSDVLDYTGLFGQALADFLDDVDMDNMRQYCCSKEEIKNWKDCYWAGRGGRSIYSCDDNHCNTGHEAELTLSPYGEGEDCMPTSRQRAFCCTPASGESLFMPVPLEYLFENPPENADDPDFNLSVDDTWGTGDTQGDSDEEPDDAAFGFVVITAPDEVHVSLDKRDGSPWELMDCPDSDSEEEHTVRMICTDSSEDSKCDHIHRGQGAPGTILQMPNRCGPGRYAVAKELKESQNQTLPGHLNKRDLDGRSVYDLTFDYDFKRVPRDYGDALMRIDYSNQPGYWDSVVDRPASDSERKVKRAKRDETGYHKNRKRWLEDEWRDAYHHGGMERHEVHKRWFGEDILNWLGQLITTGEAKATKELNHKVKEKVELLLIDQQFGPCPVGGAQAQANIRSSITASIDVETSFGITIITTLAEGMDLSRSYLYFRNAGEVEARFELDAVASLTYSTGDIKLLGLDDFPGATFRVPGVVTVGPNLAVYASADASITYPQNNEYPEKALDEPDREAKTIGKPHFDASVSANGEIALHLKPTVSFGIDFDDRWKVPRCTVDLVLDGYVIGHAEASYSLNGDNSCPFSYGIDAGSTMYAQLDAPEEFGWGDDLRVTLAEVPRKQITPSTCVGDKGKRTFMGYEAYNSSVEKSTSRRDEYMPMPVSHSIAKRDTLTLGPLVTIPDDFLNCPGQGGGENFCVMCSMYGTKVSDSDDSKRDVASLFGRDDGGSCPYYPPGDGGKCYDTDSYLFERDPQETKDLTLNFINNNAKFDYLSSKDINDNRRCSAKTTKEASTKSANNEYLIDNNDDLPASDFRTEHVFEVHLVSHFLEWVCAGKDEFKYGIFKKLPFPTGWTRPDSTWCTDVFGGPDDGMQWSRNNGKPKNWVQHTADFLGSEDNLDLLVMYHHKPNGVKQVITEGKKSGIPKDQPKKGIKVEPKDIADRVMMSATVFDYLRELSDKWTKPSQNIELISDEFDHEYTRQYNAQNQPKGKPLKKDDTPRGLKHWGLRTLWAYWIDNHLAKIEQIQSDWHKTAKDRMSTMKDAQGKIDDVAKKFADITMTTGDATVEKFMFPMSNPGNPLPGTATSSSNDQSKYGTWGGNNLGKLGL
ncbi:hypothetical protein N7537_008463 [Penicillium hordei]|uniref:chitinase n=1 Tax=Penicillium hordei TaxID=40994 RepID=A0AAD6E109_9EURO|nr:uncharacterized protein N7537_008463 [Penicillium hordei]KAJ5598379.1 hypothetical protein N7537_008463 [Penicillium hordei]